MLWRTGQYSEIEAMCLFNMKTLFHDNVRSNWVPKCFLSECTIKQKNTDRIRLLQKKSFTWMASAINVLYTCSKPSGIPSKTTKPYWQVYAILYQDKCLCNIKPGQHFSVMSLVLLSSICNKKCDYKNLN